MANQYFIGAGTGRGFGGSGNFFSAIADIGPTWQQTMDNGLVSMQRLNNFQYQQMVDPYKVHAAASGFGLQGLQNEMNSGLLFDEMQQMDLMRRIADMQRNEQRMREMGYNPDRIYQTGLANQATNETLPVQPAQTGQYASTSPQVASNLARQTASLYGQAAYPTSNVYQVPAQQPINRLF